MGGMRLQEAPCGGRADGDVRSAEAGHGPERLGGDCAFPEWCWYVLGRRFVGAFRALGVHLVESLGHYVGAAFLVVGLTIVADEHFRKDRTAQVSGKIKTPQVEPPDGAVSLPTVTRTAPDNLRPRKPAAAAGIAGQDAPPQVPRAMKN